MAIVIETTQINAKFLGGLALNKIMLGVIEIFPNIAAPADFSPSDLFVSGEQGLFYNFNDVTSVRRDAFVAGQSGGQLVALGQVFGWALDLKRPAGPQLITGAAYADIPSNWTVTAATYVVNAGVITLTNTSTARGMISQGFPTEVGKKYLVKLGVLDDGTGGVAGQNANLRVGNTNNYAASNLLSVASGQSNGYGTFVATSTTSWLFMAVFASVAGATASFGTMEIGEWDGNQAFQMTGTARPQFNSIGVDTGANLITNSDFTNDVSGWTAIMSGGISWVAGAMRIDNIAGNFGSAVQTIPESIVIGKTYRVFGKLLDAKTHDNATMTGRIAAGGWANSAIPIGKFSFTFTATTTSSIRVHHSSSTGGAFSVWEDVSLFEVALDQAFGAVFDGVDDGLASVAVDLSTSPIVTVFFGGVRRSTARAYAYGQEPAYAGNTFSKRMPESGTLSQHYWARYMNGVLQFVHATQNEPAPETFVDSCVFRNDIDGSPANVSIAPTLNGSIPTTTFGGAGGTTPNFSNNQITIGKTLANANPCNMTVSYLVVVNRECTTEEHAQMDAWGKEQLGVTP